MLGGFMEHGNFGAWYIGVLCVYTYIYIYGMYCVWYVNVCDIWYVVFYGIIMV
jgi:hypothetical protein